MDHISVKQCWEAEGFTGGFGCSSCSAPWWPDGCLAWYLSDEILPQGQGRFLVGMDSDSA